MLVKALALKNNIGGVIMEQTVMDFTLEELINQTREHLKSLNYSKETLRHYENAWKTLKNYAKEENTTYFSTDFGVKFLKTKYNIGPFDKALKTYPRTVRRSVTVLSDFQQHGIIFKRQPTKLHIWSDNYREICETFLDNYVNNRLSSRTARQFRMQLEKLTAYLEQNNINSIADVSSSIIEGYISTYTGYAKSTIAYALYILRCFFRFAYEANYTIIDFSVSIPSMKFNSKSTIPSVFTIDEIEKLLKAVDRGSPIGKRDYAILLLAVRFGMRVSEITSLQLNNLDFESQKIRYTQNKTGNPIILDMFESLGWALIDYLKNARPKTNSTHVFVRHNSPFDAFGENNNLSSIMNKYISLADIDVPKGKKHGLHTLRHSLASHLLEQGTPLHIISETLGHSEIKSTTIYTKVDLHQLSLCALEVPHETK